MVVLAWSETPSAARHCRNHDHGDDLFDLARRAISSIPPCHSRENSAFYLSHR